MVPIVWTVSVLFALASLVLTWRVLRSLRRRPGHCTTCGYDCSDLREPTCPECGKPPAARTPRRRPVLRLIPALLLSLPLLAIAFPRVTGTALSAVLPARETIAARSIHSVRFLLERDYRLPEWLDSRLRALHINHEPPAYGQFLRASNAHGFEFLLADYSIDVDDGNISKFVLLKDVRAVDVVDMDGDSTPDLVVTSYSGGAHCCWTYTILRLGEQPAILAQIEFENGASFDRRTTGSSVETIITSTDAVWNYWRSCYACTFKPEIIMRLKSGTVSLAPDLMAKPLPTDLADIERRMREIISVANFTLLEERVEPADYWHFVVELIYTGHEKEAIDLVRRTWTENGPEREIFLAELIANFESSPWAPAMRRHFGN